MKILKGIYVKNELTLQVQKLWRLVLQIWDIFIIFNQLIHINITLNIIIYDISILNYSYYY